MSLIPLSLSLPGIFLCPKSGNSSRSIVESAAGAAIGVLGSLAGFALVGPLVREVLHGGDTRWLIFPGFPVMLLFALVCHELGHLFAAWSVGFRLYSFGRLLPSPNSVAAADTADLSRRVAVVFAGGPLASLLVSLGMFALAVLPAFGGDPFARLSLLLTGIASALFFVASAVPTPGNVLLTDGGRVLGLWRGEVAAERDVHLLRLSAEMRAGIAPRDWDGKTVESALQPPDSSVFEWQARQFAYLCALDRGEIGAAGAHLDAAMDLLSLAAKPAQAAFRLEAAYFEAWHRARPEIALEWLEGVPMDFNRLPTYEHLRATAAIQAALGVRDAARSGVAEALRQITTDKSALTWSRERLIEMGNALGGS